ncbi:MAG: Asp-tRNA(Asn)/Glu-tRNA(Gln) amidotransferase subunit GatB [Ruminococcaceae bacterium]|nr:Asp-tRNA(Asn)/Glu-tRNA(Gln) amidotransferase subunit GatB [Oscillospiraceae bacterium]
MRYNVADESCPYEAVIGLEVHAELKTESKIFCSCSTEFGAVPNTNVCPVCLGMPGTLPVLNRRAVDLALMCGMAFGSMINRESHFDRKNYYYPDLPKGYQITQYETPICEGGYVPITVDGREKLIELTRIHIEEDAGKLIHRGESTLINYNRAGVPLVEIVSEPDMRTPEEAKAYLESLRRTLSYIGVSDCKMNEGSLRCDVNISVRRRGCSEFGVKCEIKNLNSINYVGRALEDEIDRQILLLEKGEAVLSETRRFNEDTGKTEHMRYKEEAIDYRYFAEPNIPPIYLTNAYIEAVERQMPKLPREVQREFCEKFGVKEEDGYLLTESRFISDYFTACAEATEYKNQCVNLFVSDVLTHLDSDSSEYYITPENLAEVCALFGEGRVVSGAAKKLIHLSAALGESPGLIAEREKMLKITDRDELKIYAENAVASCEKAVADYKKGKITAAKQLLGFVMKESGGRADPLITEEIILDLLRL